MAVPALIGAIASTASQGAQAGLLDDLKGTLNPGSFVIGRIKDARNRRDNMKKFEMEHALNERQTNINEAEMRAKLQEFYRKQRWMEKFSRALYSGNK